MGDKFPAQIRREVYEYWQEHLPDWNLGFQVFYGPVDQQPILFIGINPGGSEDSFRSDLQRFRNGDFSVEKTQHDYLSDPPRIGEKTVSTLGEEIISNSVKTNINFFRSPDVQTFEEKAQNAKTHERQCYNWVREIIEYVDPDVIIAEATRGAYDPLKKYVLDDVTELSVTKSGPSRVTCLAETPDRTIIAYPLPTGQNDLFDANANKIRNVVHDTLSDKINIEEGIGRSYNR